MRTAAYFSGRRRWNRGAAVPVAHLTLEKMPSTAAFAASIGKDAAGIAAFIAAALGMIAGSLLKPSAKAI